MKKLALLLMCLLSLLGCSAGAPFTDDDSLPDEPLGAIQQGVGTCPRPTGSSGSQVAPAGTYITGVWPDATNRRRLKVEATDLATGTKNIDYVDFGNGGALFTGPGWGGTKITTMELGMPQNADCLPGDNDNWCWAINGVKVIYVNDDFSSLHSDNPFNLSYLNGVTKIRGYGNITPQTLRFYIDTGSGGITSRTWTVSGPGMDACLP